MSINSKQLNSFNASTREYFPDRKRWIVREKLGLYTLNLRLQGEIWAEILLLQTERQTKMKWLKNLPSRIRHCSGVNPFFAKTFPTSLQVKASIPCKNSNTNSSSSAMISHSWLNIFHDHDGASMSLSSNERDGSISLTNKKPPKFPPLKQWHEETWLLLFSKFKEENKQTHYLLRLPCKSTSSNFVTKSSVDRISDILPSNLPCCNNNTDKTWEQGSLLPTREEGREEVNYTFLSRRGGVCSTYVYLLQYCCGFC